MMDLLLLSRGFLFPDWSAGMIQIRNSNLLTFSMEDEERDIKIKGETAVPRGRHELDYRQSPKFSSSFLWSDSSKKLIEAKDKDKFKDIKDWRTHDLIWLPGLHKMANPNQVFEYALFHWGNTDLDTDGCIIVGKTLTNNFPVKNKGNRWAVLQSRLHYIDFYQEVYPQLQQAKARKQKEYLVIK